MCRRLFIATTKGASEANCLARHVATCSLQLRIVTVIRQPVATLVFLDLLWLHFNSANKFKKRSNSWAFKLITCNLQLATVILVVAILCCTFTNLHSTSTDTHLHIQSNRDNLSPAKSKISIIPKNYCPLENDSLIRKNVIHVMVTSVSCSIFSQHKEYLIS